MNRKNTILIAVLINAGLLAVLFIVAISTQEESLPPSSFAASPPTIPQFEELSLPIEPVASLVEQKVDVSKQEPKKQEPLVHTLPALESSEKKQERQEELTLKAKSPSKPKEELKEAHLKEIIVKKGDNLDKLARAHQTSIDEIIKLNRLPSSFLKIGQVLKIPAHPTRSTVKKVDAKSGPEYYTIKVGENPWAIANKHHMKLSELLRLNQLNEEKARKLRPGDRLRIR